MKQYYGMSRRGNLDEALQGLYQPQFIMLFSNKDQFVHSVLSFHNLTDYILYGKFCLLSIGGAVFCPWGKGGPAALCAERPSPECGRSRLREEREVLRGQQHLRAPVHHGVPGGWVQVVRVLLPVVLVVVQGEARLLLHPQHPGQLEIALRPWPSSTAGGGPGPGAATWSTTPCIRSRITPTPGSSRPSPSPPPAPRPAGDSGPGTGVRRARPRR